MWKRNTKNSIFGSPANNNQPIKQTQTAVKENKVPMEQPKVSFPKVDDSLNKTKEIFSKILEKQARDNNVVDIQKKYGDAWDEILSTEFNTKKDDAYSQLAEFNLKANDQEVNDDNIKKFLKNNEAKVADDFYQWMSETAFDFKAIDALPEDIISKQLKEKTGIVQQPEDDRPFYKRLASNVGHAMFDSFLYAPSYLKGMIDKGAREKYAKEQGLYDDEGNLKTSRWDISADYLWNKQAALDIGMAILAVPTYGGSLALSGGAKTAQVAGKVAVKTAVKTGAKSLAKKAGLFTLDVAGLPVSFAPTQLLIGGLNIGLPTLSSLGGAPAKAIEESLNLANKSVQWWAKSHDTIFREDLENEFAKKTGRSVDTLQGQAKENFENYYNYKLRNTGAMSVLFGDSENPAGRFFRAAGDTIANFIPVAAGMKGITSAGLKGTGKLFDIENVQIEGYTPGGSASFIKTYKAGKALNTKFNELGENLRNTLTDETRATELQTQLESIKKEIDSGVSAEKANGLLNDFYNIESKYYEDLFKTNKEAANNIKNIKKEFDVLADFWTNYDNFTSSGMKFKKAIVEQMVKDVTPQAATFFKGLSPTKAFIDNSTNLKGVFSDVLLKAQIEKLESVAESARLSLEESSYKKNVSKSIFDGDNVTPRSEEIRRTIDENLTARGLEEASRKIILDKIEYDAVRFYTKLDLSLSKVSPELSGVFKSLIQDTFGDGLIKDVKALTNTKDVADIKKNGLADAIKNLEFKGNETLVDANKSIDKAIEIISDKGFSDDITKTRANIEKDIYDASIELNTTLKTLHSFDEMMASRSFLNTKQKATQEAKAASVIIAQKAKDAEVIRDTIKKNKDELKKLKEIENTELETKEVKASISKKTKLIKKLEAKENSALTKGQADLSDMYQNVPEETVKQIEKSGTSIIRSAKYVAKLITEDTERSAKLLTDMKSNSALAEIVLKENFGGLLKNESLTNAEEAFKSEQETDSESTRTPDEEYDQSTSRNDIITDKTIDNVSKEMVRIGRGQVNTDKIRSNELLKYTRNQLNVAGFLNEVREGTFKNDINILEQNISKEKKLNKERENLIRDLSVDSGKMKGEEAFISKRVDLMRNLVDRKKVRDSLLKINNKNLSNALLKEEARDIVLFRENKKAIEDFVKMNQVNNTDIKSLRNSITRTENAIVQNKKAISLSNKFQKDLEKMIEERTKEHEESRLTRELASKIAKEADSSESFYANLKQYLTEKYNIKPDEVNSYFDKIDPSIKELSYKTLDQSTNANFLKIAITDKRAGVSHEIDLSAGEGNVKDFTGRLRPRNRTESTLQADATANGFVDKEGHSSIYELAEMESNGKKYSPVDMARKVIKAGEKGIDPEDLKEANKIKNSDDEATKFLLAAAKSMIGKAYVSHIAVNGRLVRIKIDNEVHLSKGGVIVTYRDSPEYETHKAIAHQASTDAPEKLGEALAPYMVATQLKPMIDSMANAGYKFLMSGNEEGNKLMFVKDTGDIKQTPKMFYKKVLGYKDGDIDDFVKKINKRAKVMNNSDIHGSTEAWVDHMTAIGVEPTKTMRYLVVDDDAEVNRIDVKSGNKMLRKATIDGQIYNMDHTTNFINDYFSLKDKSKTAKPTLYDKDRQFVIKGQMTRANGSIFSSKLFKDALDKYNKAHKRNITVEYDENLHESVPKLIENGQEVEIRNLFDGIMTTSSIKNLADFDATKLNDGVLHLSPDKLRVKHLAYQPLKDEASFSLSTLSAFVKTIPGGKERAEGKLLEKIESEIDRAAEIMKIINIKPQDAVDIIAKEYGVNVAKGNTFGKNGYLFDNGSGASPDTIKELNSLFYNIVKERVNKLKLKGSDVKVLGSIHTDGNGHSVLDQWVNTNKPDMKDNWIVLNRDDWGNRVNKSGRVVTSRFPVNKSFAITSPKVLWLDEIPAYLREDIGKNAILNPKDLFAKKEGDFDGDTLMIFTDEVLVNPETIKYIDSFATHSNTKDMVVDLDNVKQIEFIKNKGLLKTAAGTDIDMKDLDKSSRDKLKTYDNYVTDLEAFMRKKDINGESWDLFKLLAHRRKMLDEIKKPELVNNKHNSFFEKVLFSSAWKKMEDSNFLKYLNDIKNDGYSATKAFSLDSKLEYEAHKSAASKTTQDKPQIDETLAKEYKKLLKNNKAISSHMRAERTDFNVKVDKIRSEIASIEDKKNKILYNKSDSARKKKDASWKFIRKSGDLTSEEFKLAKDVISYQKDIDNSYQDINELVADFSLKEKSFIDSMQENKGTALNMFRDKMTESYNDITKSKPAREAELKNYEDWLIQNRWSKGIFFDIISPERIDAYYKEYYNYYHPENFRKTYGFENLDINELSNRKINDKNKELDKLIEKYQNENDPVEKIKIKNEATDLSDKIKQEVVDEIISNYNEAKTFNADTIAYKAENENNTIAVKILRDVFGDEKFSQEDYNKFVSMNELVVKKIKAGKGYEFYDILKVVNELGSAGIAELRKAGKNDSVVEAATIKYMVDKMNSQKLRGFKDIFNKPTKAENEKLANDLVTTLSNEAKKTDSDQQKFYNDANSKRAEIASKKRELESKILSKEAELKTINDTVELMEKVAVEKDFNKQQKLSEDYVKKLQNNVASNISDSAERLINEEKSRLYNNNGLDNVTKDFDKKLNEASLTLNVKGVTAFDEMMHLYANTYKSASVGMAAGRIVSETIQSGMLNVSQKFNLAFNGVPYTKELIQKKFGKNARVPDAGNVEIDIAKQEYKNSRNIANLPHNKLVEFTKKRVNKFNGAMIAVGQKTYGRSVSKLSQMYYEKVFYKSLSDEHATGNKDIFKDQNKLSSENRVAVRNKINELKRKARQETESVFFSYAQHPQLMHNLETVIPFSNFFLAGMRLMYKHPKLFLGSATAIEQFNNTYGTENYYIDEDGQKIDLGKAYKSKLLAKIGLGSITMNMQRLLQASPDSMSSIGMYPLYAYANGSSDWRVKKYLKGESSFYELAGSTLSPSFSQLLAGITENDPKKWLPAVSYLTTGFAVKDKSMSDVWTDYYNQDYEKILKYNSGIRNNFYKSIGNGVTDEAIEASKEAKRLGLLGEDYDPFSKAVNVMGKAISNKKISEIIDGDHSEVGNVDSHNALIKSEAFAYKQLVDFTVGKQIYTHREDNEWLEKMKEFADSPQFEAFKTVNPGYYDTIKHYANNFTYYKEKNDAHKLADDDDSKKAAKGRAMLLALKYKFKDAGATTDAIAESIIAGETEPLTDDGTPMLTEPYQEEIKYKGYLVAEMEENIRDITLAKSLAGIMTSMAIDEDYEPKKNYYWAEANKQKAAYKKAEKKLLSSEPDVMNAAVSKFYKMKLEANDAAYGSGKMNYKKSSNYNVNSGSSFDLKYYDNIYNQFLENVIKNNVKLANLKGKTYSELPAEVKMQFKALYGASPYTLENRAKDEAKLIESTYPEFFGKTATTIPTADETYSWIKPQF